MLNWWFLSEFEVLKANFAQSCRVGFEGAWLESYGAYLVRSFSFSKFDD